MLMKKLKSDILYKFLNRRCKGKKKRINVFFKHKSTRYHMNGGFMLFINK